MKPALMMLTGGVVLVVAGLSVAAYALGGVLAAVSTGLLTAGVCVAAYALLGMNVGGRGKR
jgi:hypothetical protein